VRLPAYAALLLAMVALVGCSSNGNGEGDAAWAGPPQPAEDGTVAVEDFAAYQEGVDERWERSAETVAAEFLRLDERTAVRTTIEGESGGEGAGPRSVTVTLDGLLDDSVRAERWMLVLEQRDDGYALASAIRTLRCQPGRGHDEFTPEACV
jgi:hypothetical protein